MKIEEADEDKFNLGFCISNIGPKITFVDAEQADPSPTNMRMGLFAQLYNDGNNKLNFMFDANKLLVVASQTVIDILLNDESTNVVELESVIGRKINFQVETSYTQEQFDIILL